MLIQLLADVTRDKKIIAEFIKSPDKVLKRYPGITRQQAQCLKNRNLASVSQAVGAEVAKHFSGPRYRLMYVGVDITFSSLVPNSHKVGDPVNLTMVLDVKQAPTGIGALKSSVDFNHRSDATTAKVTSTVLNLAKKTITIKMTANFKPKGSYNAYVKVWATGTPAEYADLTTKNIFSATAS